MCVCVCCVCAAYHQNLHSTSKARTVLRSEDILDGSHKFKDCWDVIGGCMGLGWCLQKSSQRQKYTDLCVFLHESSCPRFSAKQKISIGYFWRPEYINPKMTEKSARVLSDEGRANWWSRHQASTCWSTPAVIYDSRRRIQCILGTSLRVCERRRPHESVWSVDQLEHLLCFVKWNLNSEPPRLYELINRFVSHWRLHPFEDVFSRQELEEPLWSVQVKLP